MKKTTKIKVLGNEVIIKRKNLEHEGVYGQINTNISGNLVMEIHDGLSGNDFLTTIMHELLELLSILLRFRYMNENGNKDDNFFMFDHDKLTTMADVLSSAYEDIKTKLSYTRGRVKLNG